MSALNAIYACKLYRAHANKDKIKAAMESPLNVELVQQLSEYLNEEDLAKLAPPEGSEAFEGQEPKKTKLRESEGSPSSGGGFSSNSDDEFFNDDEEITDDEELVDDGIIVDDDSQVVDDDDIEVEESTNVSGDSVNSATTLYNNDTGNRVLSMPSVAEVLKGTLNSRQDTSGVIRSTVKENELWLHYNDSMNLNTVMVPVIEFMNSAGYSYLNFNRLARSENAIVFEICAADTDVRVGESGDKDE
ncbi:MAG: hypothetical protein IJB54_01090 [Firmicutes bacterium]|nr:hypothetical protein [Bacillota bacterium]